MYETYQDNSSAKDNSKPLFFTEVIFRADDEENNITIATLPDKVQFAQRSRTDVNYSNRIPERISYVKDNLIIRFKAIILPFYSGTINENKNYLELSGYPEKQWNFLQTLRSRLITPRTSPV